MHAYHLRLCPWRDFAMWRRQWIPQRLWRESPHPPMARWGHSPPWVFSSSERPDRKVTPLKTRPPVAFSHPYSAPLVMPTCVSSLGAIPEPSWFQCKPFNLVSLHAHIHESWWVCTLNRMEGQGLIAWLWFGFSSSRHWDVCRAMSGSACNTTAPDNIINRADPQARESRPGFGARWSFGPAPPAWHQTPPADVSWPAGPSEAPKQTITVIYCICYLYIICYFGEIKIQTITFNRPRFLMNLVYLSLLYTKHWNCECNDPVIHMKNVLHVLHVHTANFAVWTYLWSTQGSYTCTVALHI